MKERMWRTLIRVVSRNDYKDEITITVPGWDSKVEITLAATKFPSELLPKLQPDFRLHAQVNIGAEDVKRRTEAGETLSIL